MFLLGTEAPFDIRFVSMALRSIASLWLYSKALFELGSMCFQGLGLPLAFPIKRKWADRGKGASTTQGM